MVNKERYQKYKIGFVIDALGYQTNKIQLRDVTVKRITFSSDIIFTGANERIEFGLSEGEIAEFPDPGLLEFHEQINSGILGTPGLNGAAGATYENRRQYWLDYYFKEMFFLGVINVSAAAMKGFVILEYER